MEAIKTKTSLWNYCECLHQNLSIDPIVFYFWCHVSGLLKMQSLELEYIELMESINTMKKFLQKQHQQSNDFLHFQFDLEWLLMGTEESVFAISLIKQRMSNLITHYKT